MENEEKSLSPEESLRIIRQTIDVAKANLRENGFYFLLWGTLVILACLTQYYLDVMAGAENPYWPWFVMPLIGVPAGILFEKRRDRRHPGQRTGNIIHSWYGLVWLGFLIAMFIAIFVAVSSRVSPVPYILLLAGFATYMSGVLLRFRPLFFGAAALAVGAILCLWVPGPEHVLVEAGAIVLGYIVPGLMLNARTPRNELTARPA